MPSPLVFPHVPIVGQSLKAHTGYAMATFTCLCREGNEPTLLRGTDQIEACAHCRTVYAIVKVEFDRMKGQTLPSISIAPIGRAQQPEAPNAS